MTGVFDVIVLSVHNFESILSSRKFSSRTCFVTGHLLSRIHVFHLNQVVKPLSQFSASVSIMSRLWFTVGFNVFSRHCGKLGLGMRFAGVGFRFWFGVVLVALFVLILDALQSKSGSLGRW